MGLLIGAVATWFIVALTSNPSPLRLSERVDYRKLEWVTINAAEQVHSGDVTLQARIWNHNGAYYLIEPKELTDGLKDGDSPVYASPPAFRVSDESFLTREWLLKSSNGGVVAISGHLIQVPERPSWLLGDFDRVDAVTLDNGIDVTWSDLESSSENYHEKVVRIAGRIGRHPTLSHLYLYRDEDSWRARSVDKALMLGRKFVPHEDSNYMLLDRDGVEVVVEGVFQRPFRDNGEAPAGAITILHRIIVGKH